ncbi:hypothetical protein HMPREF0860_0836 [Treponema socranskii subsp. socranskii VPI DR56BR1116 = ATCC 35536]|uniref:Uncharacterized protein n=1 Tax=Treponema socranskii subsp. socranskii VPI DR56BR1116 = ATCC 35536 TaxID=1125725 RepID=U1FPH3_TRESO|nr:hypothetical protein HMPREF1325_2118 [Treponema socranskii subsp. socranskii VPI DR56BR1116 = ATCC 35536]ERK04547.1 hypothetical protein HMPREF0860_0836 [Treponema socranskii subsp. socranskii VPI DR56BR1116 = ATCC 35536]
MPHFKEGKVGCRASRSLQGCAGNFARCPALLRNYVENYEKYVMILIRCRSIL